MFLTDIHINALRHLKDLDITLSRDKRQHLILTGKNGSGKTSLLEGICNRLDGISGLNKPLNLLVAKDVFCGDFRSISIVDISIRASTSEEYDKFSVVPPFICAYFDAARLTKVDKPRGVEKIALRNAYKFTETPVGLLLKYMVHLKTQLVYAKNENDENTALRIQKWFDLYTNALRDLMDDQSVELHYDYKNYNFLIHQNGRNPYSFMQLSDGYSAAIMIVSDLLMRMDQNWLINNTTQNTSLEGIVLIDEIETHLHLSLQRKILPFLTSLFPNIQFIVSTHSPFVVNSIDNAVIYDLENHITVPNGLTNYSYEGVVEGYFKVDELSDDLKQKFERYKALVHQPKRSDDELDELMDLELYLDNIPDYLMPNLAAEYQKLKLECAKENER